MAASLACWGLGVPGQDRDKSWSPAAVGVKLEEAVEEQGEEERAASPASFRGCSERMDSWEKEMQILSFPLEVRPTDSSGFSKDYTR